MLEINKVIFENKLFFENYDFYDIPGLNEYIKNNENSKQINLIEQESNLESLIDEDAPPSPYQYIENNANKKNFQENENKIINKETDNEIYKTIRGIFKYLKGKIENFVFIISCESCYKPENLNILKEIRKNIDFDFQGGLFILSKIDKAENKDDTIFECKKNFINNINSKVFNLHFNIFIPLNSHNFRNEIFMKEKIKYFFLYYFNKYCDEYVYISEDLKREKNKNFI